MTFGVLSVRHESDYVIKKRVNFKKTYSMLMFLGWMDLLNKMFRMNEWIYSTDIRTCDP